MAHDHHHQHLYQEPVIHKPGEAQRYKATKRVTLIGAVVNVVLSVVKIVFGTIGQSHSLVADGVHSLSDLLSDVLVIYAAKHGSRDADEEHPYGHARIETAFTVGLGFLLILVAGGIMADATQRLFHPENLLTPGWLALSVAAISVVAKELLYYYTLHVANKVRSNLLRANAWHHRSDAVSSVVVIVGVGGTMAGLPYLDAIASIGVALMIAKIGWELGWHSIRELVDTALEPERVEAIGRTIMSVDGVREMHLLRTRRMGPDALVDVHILVNPHMSVSEGHHIGENVRARLIKEIDEVSDVMVHIDPEDDEHTKHCCHLPMRDKVMALLEQHWQEIDVAKKIEKVTLHYLRDKIQVEVVMPLQMLREIGEATELKQRFAQLADKEEEIESIEVVFR